MKIKTITSKNDLKKTNEFPDLILIDADEKISRSIIASLKERKFLGKIGVFGRDNVFNRRALETLKIDFLVSPERELREKKIFRKDTLKQRDSGLNHVLAKIAREKNVEIVFDFDSFSEMKDKKNKASRLARIIQNVKICRRAKCGVRVVSFSSSVSDKALRAFGFSVGMSSQQVKGCYRL